MFNSEITSDGVRNDESMYLDRKHDSQAHRSREQYADDPENQGELVGISGTLGLSATATFKIRPRRAHLPCALLPACAGTRDSFLH